MLHILKIMWGTGSCTKAKPVKKKKKSSRTDYWKKHRNTEKGRTSECVTPG